MMDRDERRARRRLAGTVASASLAASTTLLVASTDSAGYRRTAAPTERGTGTPRTSRRSLQPTR